MATPDFDLPPQSGPRERRIKGMQGGQGQFVPPQPYQPAPGGDAYEPSFPASQRARAEGADRRGGPTVNKTRNGGGFNPSFNPGLNINLVKTVNGGGGNGAGQGGPGPAGARGTGTPGSGFMSNEDIHKFAEHIRKEGRKRATERSMDAEQLEAVLRTIPDLNGSLGGSRMRARRVSRHLKRIAKAEQLISKEATSLYAAFEREYDANLRTVGKGRLAPPPRAAFNFR